MRAPSAPASVELVQHHAREHARGHGVDEVGLHDYVCPCGQTIALICAECRQPVFLATRTPEWCAHAVSLWAEL